MTESPIPISAETLPAIAGMSWRRLKIGETGSYLVLAADIPTPIKASALDVVELVASAIPGTLILRPKQPPIVTTEQLGPGVLLQVEPKCGPVSLVRLLLAADEPAATLLDQQVLYGAEPEVTILQLLVKRLLDLLSDVWRYGWIGGDIERTLISDTIEGQLEFQASLLESTTRAQVAVVQRVWRHTINVPPNRVIASTIELLTVSVPALSEELAQQLTETAAHLPAIEPYTTAIEASLVCADLLDRDRIPPNREYYGPVIRLCRLLLDRFAVTQAGEPIVEYPPLRLAMAPLFERMVRNTISTALAPEYVVRSAADDIELGGQQTLYDGTTSGSFNAALEPDVVVRPFSDLTKVTAIFDAKYKDAPSADDHYQLYAYMSRYQATVGGFVALGAGSSQQAYTTGGKNVHAFGLDLANITQAMQQLAQWVRSVLAAAP